MFRAVYERRFGRVSLLALTLLLVVAAAGTVQRRAAAQRLRRRVDDRHVRVQPERRAGSRRRHRCVQREHRDSRDRLLRRRSGRARRCVRERRVRSVQSAPRGSPSSAVSGQITARQCLRPSEAALTPAASGRSLPDLRHRHHEQLGRHERRLGAGAHRGQRGNAAKGDGDLRLVDEQDRHEAGSIETTGTFACPDADALPAKDAFGGTTSSFNAGYGAEVTWNANTLKAYDPTTGTYQLRSRAVAAWPTHGPDCNTDPRARGAMAWYDSDNVGYAVACTGTFPVAISQITRRPTALRGEHRRERRVQPTRARTTEQPDRGADGLHAHELASWGGGCGTVSTGTIDGLAGRRQSDEVLRSAASGEPIPSRTSARQSVSRARFAPSRTRS